MLAPIRPVSLVPADLTKGRIHDQCDRVVELSAEKNRHKPGPFPFHDEAAVRLLWLEISDIEDKRALARAKEQAREAKQGKATQTITGAG